MIIRKLSIMTLCVLLVSSMTHATKFSELLLSPKTDKSACVLGGLLVGSVAATYAVSRFTHKKWMKAVDKSPEEEKWNKMHKIAAFSFNCSAFSLAGITSVLIYKLHNKRA